MSDTPRTRRETGLCSACPAYFMLRKDGTIGAHNFRTSTGRATLTPCAGVGRPPRQED